MPYVALPHAGRIHYAERGDRRAGRPSAVLVHGAAASSAIWMMVLARVARAGHAVAIDLPAHGPSGADGAALDGSTGLTLARYRDAVGELAGTLCLGPSVLVGHSLGALVAIEAALAWPTRCARWCCAARRRGCPSTTSWRAAARRSGARVAWLASTRCRRARAPAVRRGFLAAGDVHAGRRHARRLRDRARHPTSARASARLAARSPGWTAPTTGSWPRRTTPRAVITLPDVGHLTPIEAPAAVAEAVAASLAALP
jgi:pimeloyl-ACP methyl ester carboxylesterase